MSDWFKFNAWVRDKSGKKHLPPEFPVIVWGVTRETAQDKLLAEYPSKDYEIVSLDQSLGGMHLSDPDAPKSYK